MRPLLPPEVTELAWEPGVDVLADLLDQFGPYCSICERPLHDRAYAWDPATTLLTSPYQEHAPSPETIPLCATCAEVVGERDGEIVDLTLPFAATLALPWDQGLAGTPAVGGGGFAYLPMGAVTGLDVASIRTVDYFRLGRSPRADVRSVLRARTAALAARTLQAPTADLLDYPRSLWLADLVATTGFLSVWVTLLAALSASPDPVRAFLAQAHDVVPGFYPGTDWSRLLPPPPVARF